MSSLPRIILASASPRRQQLLKLLRLHFDIHPADIPETFVDGEPPETLAQRLSYEKASTVAKAGSDALIIAADTIVVLDGHILGKPGSTQEAQEMLTRLAGRGHDVHTGLTLTWPAYSLTQTLLASTRVYMRAFTQQEIARYVASGDPMDKAGAYAIQNSAFNPVARIEGCYANVVGLPLCHLYALLRAWGLALEQHPLEICPWAVAQRDCPWAEPIIRALISGTDLPLPTSSA